MRKIKSNQAGFTLIELVVVIVILGILAATALPKFVNLSDEAGNAAANGVAGAIASSSAANYAARVAGQTGIDVNAAEVCTNTILESLVSGVKFIDAPTNGNQYKAGGTGNCSGAGKAGTAVTCTVTGYKGIAQNATVICSG